MTPHTELRVLAAHDLASAVRRASVGLVRLHPDTSRHALELLTYGDDAGRAYDSFETHLRGDTVSSLERWVGDAADDLTEAVLVASDGTDRIPEADARLAARLLVGLVEDRPRDEFGYFTAWLRGEQHTTSVRERIAAAADEHATRADGAHTTLASLIPDGKFPHAFILDAVADLTGARIDDRNPPAQTPAWLRSRLSRWVAKDKPSPTPEEI